MRFAVANLLGTPAAGVEFPWNDGDEGFLDLRQEPLQINNIAAARENPAFAAMLAAMNSAPSIFCSSRAKAWCESRVAATAEEQMHFLSRLEFVFTYESLNSSAVHGENAARRIVDLWMKDAESGSVRARLEILPCRFKSLGANAAALRIILDATGSSLEQARMRWGLSVARLQQSLLFVSRAMRQELALED